ncbi:MAG: lysine decarboxylase [Lautropia sp.]
MPEIDGLYLDADGRLRDARGRAYDAAAHRWRDASADADAVASAPGPKHTTLTAIDAMGWLQRRSGHPLRTPVGVIGPRDATDAQLEAARAVGAGLARIGLIVVCGGRHGVMQAVAHGVAQAGGLSIGLLPDATPELANPHLSVVLATGLGEARNAVVARSASCLVAIGDSYGTLSEVALGLQFGKRVFGLEGAARVEGVEHLPTPDAAVDAVARHLLD